MAAARAAALALAAFSLAGSAGAESPADCFDRAMVTVYVHHLQDRVMAWWGIPPDTMADREVIVALWLDGEGGLVHHELVSSTNRRLASSVEVALEHAAPFGPVPEEAACLIGKKLVLKFENPH